MNKIYTTILFAFLCLNLNAQNFEWAFTTNQYDRCNDFSDGLAIVKKGFLRGYINREGQVHLKPQFNIIDAFAEGTASAGYTNFETMESKSGFINRAGEFVIEPQFEVTSPFQEGIACVRLNELWGFINESGQIIIPAKFESASTFSDGLAPVQYKGKWGVLNRSGNFVIEPKLEYLLAESEGLFCAKIRDNFSGLTICLI